MRSVSLAVGLAAGLALFGWASDSQAGSAASKSGLNTSPNHSRAATQNSSSAVPPNCVRESCGRLWCWNMRSKS